MATAYNYHFKSIAILHCVSKSISILPYWRLPYPFAQLILSLLLREIGMRAGCCSLRLPPDKSCGYAILIRYGIS